MSYLQKNKLNLGGVRGKSGNLGRVFNSAKHPNRLKMIFVAGFIFIIFVLAFIFPKPMRNFFATTAVPVWQASATIGNGLQNLAGFFSGKSSLISQVTSLQNQISSLELKQIDYDAVLKENQDLKSLFGRRVVGDAKTQRDQNLGNGRSVNVNIGTGPGILARVVSKPPQSPYDTFVLDIGTQDGASVGDKVYISDTVLIGEIAEASDKNSIVNLFSKSGLINGFVDERTGATYQVSGRGGANMSVEVPKDADILWGDTFSYPSLKTSIIGSVFYIDSSEQSSFKTVYLRVPGNVFQTEWMVDTK